MLMQQSPSSLPITSSRRSGTPPCLASKTFVDAAHLDQGQVHHSERVTKANEARLGDRQFSRWTAIFESASRPVKFLTERTSCAVDFFYRSAISRGPLIGRECAHPIEESRDIKMSRN